MKEFTCPEFEELDDELKQDFYASTLEAIEIMDGCVDRLAQDAEVEDLNELFRAIHSVKGNCNMVFIAPIVESLHELEEIVTDVRDHVYPYHRRYGEFFQAVIHETDEVLREYMDTHVGNQEVLDSLAELVNRVHTALEEERIQTAEIGTDAILQSHFSFEQAYQERMQRLQQPSSSKKEVAEKSFCTGKTHVSSMAFFEDLVATAYVLDQWRPVRLQRTLQLCEDLNQSFPESVDSEQLKAAIYVHEFSMRLIPETILYKDSSLTDEEFKIVQKHARIGAGLLQQIPGFEDAADFVLRHHERFDGKGYPCQVEGDHIPLGATILAMADTFIAITSDRADRSYKQTLMTAVRTINAEKDKQFSEQQVNIFNQLIKSSYIGKSRWRAN